MPLPPDAQVELWPWMESFTATTGRRIHGMTKGVAGSGTIVDAADPAAGATRRVHRCRAPGSNHRGIIVFNLTIGETGATSYTESFSDVTIEMEAYLDWQAVAASPTKIMGFLFFIDEVGTTILGQVAMANGGNARLDTSDATNSSSTGGEIPEKTWKLFRARYRASTGASDGTLQFWIADLDGSNKTLIHTHTHNVTTSVGRIGFGSRNIGFGAVNIDAYVATCAVHRQTTIDRFTELDTEPFCIKDGGLPLWVTGVTQTAMSVSVQWHPSVHDAAWTTGDDVQFQVEYVAGDYDDSDFPGSGTSTSGTVDIPAADEFVGCHAVTGLTAGTLYSARINTFRSSAPSTKYNGPVFQFRTLPSSPTTLEFTHSFCQKVEELMPLSDGDIANETSLHFRVMSGDDYYLDQAGATVAPTAFAPCTTAQEFLRDRPRTVLMSRFAILANRKSAKFLQDDDHDANENNWDQGYVKGFVTATNTGGTDGLDRASAAQDAVLAAVPLTKGEVYDRFQEAWWKLSRKAQVGTVVAGSAWYDRSEYRLVETGASALCFLDTRRYQDATGDQPFSGGVKTVLGADQLAYWLDYLENDCDKANVLIFSSANISDLHTATDDWQTDSVWIAEWVSLEAAMMANPAIKRVYLFSGDRHATCIDRRKKAGQYGRTTQFSKMVGHARIGPKAAGSVPSFYNETITQDVVYTSDLGAGGSGRPAKGYGRYSLNESTGRIDYSVILDNGTVETLGNVSSSVSSIRSRGGIGSRRESWLTGRP